jgi:hypothetical protein
MAPDGPSTAQSTVRRDQARLGYGRIAAFGIENIGETPLQIRAGRLVHIGRDARALLEEEGADVVDAVGLVGVVVGEEHRVQPATPFGHQRLAAEIRRGVDHHRGLGGPLPLAAGEQRTARAAVLRLGRIAGAPIAVGPRRRPEEPQPRMVSSRTDRSWSWNRCEKPEEGVFGPRLGLAQGPAADLGQLGEDVRQIGRLVAPPAHRHGRQIGAVGLEMMRSAGMSAITALTSSAALKVAMPETEK